MTNILGIDVSKWEDNNATAQQINWTTAKAAGARFAFIKAGQGNWQDEDFAYNWRGSRSAGIPRGAYWYFDNRYDAGTQANTFWNIMKAQNDHGELPLVCDFEDRQSPLPAPATARTRLKTFLASMKNVDGRTPIIYTGPAYWAELGSTETYWMQFPLWIAHYGVTAPKVPLPWTGWTFWQYTPSGDGLKFGMESKGLDMNWYQIGHGFDTAITATPPPAPVTITDQQKVAILWEAHPELHT
jgi:lysozyme